MAPMDRRLFLRSAALTGAAGLLAACTGGEDAAAPAATPGAEPSSLDDYVAQIAPDAEPGSLSVVTGSFEQLVGAAQPFAFGVTTAQNEGLDGAEVELYVVPSGRPSTGPYPTTFRELPENPLGLYVATVDLDAGGPTAFVAVTADGARTGLAAVEVRTIETSQVPAPTRPALAVATPTVAAPGPVATICTRQPACPMHEVSLDAALREGRPVVLEFATPAYCQTTACGPSVDVLDAVRADRDWGDTAFIHVEIYADEGVTLAPSVQEWALPSEPWLFTIARDGTIAGRADGSLLVLADHVTALAEQLQ